MAETSATHRYCDECGQAITGWWQSIDGVKRCYRCQHKDSDPGLLRARAESAEAEVRALRERLAAALEGLRAIAEPDALLDANEDAFNDHAARWMKAQAQVEIRAATADPTPEPECSLSDCPFDRPHYHRGDDEAVFTDDPHYPQHQWVWVDGNNVDAVVIYREWQRYQRASAERWEHESNQPVGDDTPAPTAQWTVDYNRVTAPDGIDCLDAHSLTNSNRLAQQVADALNRAGTAPDLTALLPTVAEVLTHPAARRFTPYDIKAVLVAVAALVRSAQNDTDGGTHGD